MQGSTRHLDNTVLANVAFVGAVCLSRKPPAGFIRFDSQKRGILRLRVLVVSIPANGSDECLIMGRVCR